MARLLSRLRATHRQAVIGAAGRHFASRCRGPFGGGDDRRVTCLSNHVYIFLTVNIVPCTGIGFSQRQQNFCVAYYLYVIPVCRVSLQCLPICLILHRDAEVGLTGTN